jgi:hypothetical protein
VFFNGVLARQKPKDKGPLMWWPGPRGPHTPQKCNAREQHTCHVPAPAGCALAAAWLLASGLWPNG